LVVGTGRFYFNSRLGGFAVTAMLCTLVGLSLAISPAQDTGKKKDDSPKVGALPPHPLDSLFQKANTPNDAGNGVLRSDIFKKACEAAMKAKKEQEELLKKNKGMVGPTPAQAARVKFLEVLSDGGTTGAKPAAGAKPPRP
jgi:hypothetical protein